jgi:hypothetical protein
LGGPQSWSGGGREEKRRLPFLFRNRIPVVLLVAGQFTDEFFREFGIEFGNAKIKQIARKWLTCAVLK